MPEYIERKLLLKGLRKEHRECEKDWEKMGGESILLAEGVESAIDIVKGFPAADVAPVAHGRWIHTDSHLWYKTDDGRIDEWRLDVDYHNGPECQVCGYTPCMHCHPDYMEDKCPKGHYICSECANESVDGHEKFCPNCGAKMDLEER